MSPEIAKYPLGGKSPPAENDCSRGSHDLCLLRLFTTQTSWKKQSRTKAICASTHKTCKTQEIHGELPLNRGLNIYF